MSLDVQRFQVKWHGVRPGSESAFYWGQILQERQPMLQRNVFSENYEVTLNIALDQLAFGTDQKAAVEEVGLFKIRTIRVRLSVVRTDDHPHVMPAREFCDGFKGLLVKSQ